MPLKSPAAAANERRAELGFRVERTQDADPLAWYGSVPGPSRFFYGAPGDAVAGAGTAVRIEAQGEDRFAEIMEEARRTDARCRVERGPGVPSDVGPRWMGGFQFAPDPAGSTGAVFVLPRLQIIRTPEGTFRVDLIGASEETSGPSPKAEPKETQRFAWTPDPDFQAWATLVRSSLQAIRSQQVEKVVLARTLRAPLARPLDPARVLAILHDVTPSSRLYAFGLGAGDVFLGASPELLLRRDADTFSTVALAGSRPRGTGPADDEALSRNLLSSSKDAWEHELVCRFVRGVLERRGRPFRTPVERAVLQLPNVQHLETRFETRAEPDEHILGLAAQLHPTPAVCGAPTDAARALLERLEPRPRGWYAGCIGWFDAAGRGELAVAIRCAELAADHVRLWAGCGIVNESDPSEEWQESSNKFDLLRRAIEEAGA